MTDFILQRYDIIFLYFSGYDSMNLTNSYIEFLTNEFHKIQEISFSNNTINQWLDQALENLDEEKLEIEDDQKIRALLESIFHD